MTEIQLSLFGDNRYTPVLKPLIPWTGGKSWATQKILNKIDRITEGKPYRYVEPFVGAGAIAFALGKPETVVNDVNPYLARLYQHIKIGYYPEEGKLEDFYLIRDQFNQMEDVDNKARLFYQLARTTFNGVIRFSRSGKFNGGKGNTNPRAQNFDPYQKLLKSWEIYSGDYREIPLKSSDVVFADPPYDTPHNAYYGAWTWDDQVACARYFSTSPGRVLIMNQATPRILDLYDSLGVYDIELVDAPRCCSGNGDRTPATEMLALK